MQSIREIGSLHAHIGNRAADRICCEATTTTWRVGKEKRRSSGDVGRGACLNIIYKTTAKNTRQNTKILR